MFPIACFPFILEMFVSVLKSLGSKDDQVLAGLGLSFMYRQYVLGRAHLWVFFSIFSVFQVFVCPFFQRLGCRPPLEDRSLWRWDCLSYASVWRGASVTAHRTVGFRFLGWQELQSLLCSWGFFPWLAHLDATQASCVL